MSQTLTQIAKQLKDTNKKVQLIYAFNSTGKTRLSREFKQLIAPKNNDADEAEQTELSRTNILYYNAFTEDLFYWDNDLEADNEPKLKIQPNSFINWILKEEGQDSNIITNFQHYTSNKLTPRFNEDFSEITFSFQGGNDENSGNVKISKGEESNFIWSIFYTLIEEVISTLNVPEPTERSTKKFDGLEYIFIDDPVSSMDDNNLIELAVNLAGLIKDSTSNLKFIITTHNPLFYNVLCNEFNRKKCTTKKNLKKLDDGTFSIETLDSDSPFAYHLFLLSELEKAKDSNNIQKYHFNFLRNILEKTATFLGYDKWEELLPQDARAAYYKRILNLSSHSKHHGEEVSIIDEKDKKVFIFLLQTIKETYKFK